MNTIKKGLYYAATQSSTSIAPLAAATLVGAVLMHVVDKKISTTEDNIKINNLTDRNSELQILTDTLQQQLQDITSKQIAVNDIEMITNLQDELNKKKQDYTTLKDRLFLLDKKNAALEDRLFLSDTKNVRLQYELEHAKRKPQYGNQSEKSFDPDADNSEKSFDPSMELPANYDEYPSDSDDD